MRRTTRIVVVAGCLAPAPSAVLAATWYVDQSVEESGDGRSWAGAFNTVPEALEHPELGIGDEIRIAQGVYRPVAPGEGDRCASFRVGVDLRIVGGFAPGGSRWEPAVHPCVLTGEIGDHDRVDDNSTHVVVITGTAIAPLADVWLDGLTITGAHATGTAGDCLGGSDDERGAAIFVEHASPVIRRCVIVDNHAGESGGGVFARNGSITLVQCTLRENTVPGSVFGAVGGAVCHVGGVVPTTVILQNCIFSDNGAYEGGAVSVVQSRLGGSDIDVTVVNGRFLRNSANEELIGCGGAIRATSGRQVVVNCTFTGNTAAFGSAVFLGNGTMRNVILWSNPGSDIAGSVQVAHSLVEGGWHDGGPGILDADPRFRGSSGDDLRLEPASPAIDAGDVASIRTLGDPFDLDDDGDLDEAAPDLDLLPRIVDRGGRSVDLGAYEYVCLGDVDRNGRVDNADTLGVLIEWGPCDGCPADVSADGRVDFHDLLLVLGHAGLCPGVSDG